MQKPILLLTIFLSGCGGEQASNNSQATDEPASPVVASSDRPLPDAPPVVPPTPAPAAKLPFDMPMMPGARYKSGLDFSKPTKKRGPEAIATIIAKGTTLEVVEFYERALTENGFTPTLSEHNNESTARVSGRRANGETFSVTSMQGGSKAGTDECQTAIVATKPKLADAE